ncbi:MAG TPA: undecaprenyldiphospho-muramoylpentapeptide beta-N-acetylglucosaminyltransferase [Candidatus Binataceae bacterium]|nr:undecaprenyldiphospho-muramoylpentapeptide beta-N-acetylglucosaminyltransferase [Candidatus Binataceae bacterium]
MKVIIAGGGTGGHLFPAVAVGEELKRQSPANEILYVGASNGLEARWLPRHGLPHELLQVRGWTGKGQLTRMRALGEFAAAVGHAWRLIRRAGADLVVGAGGYASAPVAVAAILTRTPLVLLEQNTRPGLANRLLWRFAKKICVGFAESTADFAPGKVAVTGNPVRFESRPEAHLGHSGPLQILVLGGSSGAHRLNIGVLKAFQISAKGVIKFDLIHQTGEMDAKAIAEGYGRLGWSAQVTPFIDDMAAALASADLVIARSGAMTVSEMALAGRPAVFVPYPFHRDRQQELNARVLERLGAARIVRDDEQLGENLAKVLLELTADRAALAAMGQRAAAAAMPRAAQAIAQICVKAAQAGRSA